MRTHLVERVATVDRKALVTTAVVEAARRYVAAHLFAERAEPRSDGPEGDAVLDRDDCLQDLRDVLAAHSRIRGRR